MAESRVETPGPRQLVWSAKVDPSVMACTAEPVAFDHPDAFEIRCLSLATTTVVGTSGAEHLAISDGLRRIRLDVIDGTLLQGPVRLNYRLAGFAGAEPQLLTLQRLLALHRLSASIEPAAATDAGKVALDSERDPNGQQRKSDFVGRSAKDDSLNPHVLAGPVSPYMLTAGTVIAGSLITGIRSDLPGLVTAQVSENVFDSASGRILLVPQGARLIGKYDSVVAYGQKRALVVWRRIVLPDGSSIGLDNVSASDASGYSGLADKVDAHSWALLKGVVISTLLGVGSELQFSGQGGLVQAIRQSGQQNIAHAGDQLTSKTLNVQPTITIRPGTPVRLVVEKDLVLAPWRG